MSGSDASRTVTDALSSLTVARRGFLERRGARFPLSRAALAAVSGFGLLLGLMIVVSWGRLGPEPGSRNPTGWLGLLAVVAPDDASKARLLFVLVPALVLLLLGWWQLQRLAAAHRLTSRTAAFVAACWAAPFALGPVIGSRDAYAYVAQGELARRGLDPAQAVVSQLGPGPLLDAVDPRWRETRPPYGGVAVAIQKAAAAGDRDPAVSLLILRLVALASVVLIVLLATRLVGASRRPFVVVILACNPLILIHLVGGAHLDAVAAALMMVALVLARGPGIGNALLRRGAIVACTLGALVKLPAGLAVLFLLIAGVLAAPAGRKARVLLGDLLTGGVAVALASVVSGTGLGWLHNFGTPGRLRTGIAPADLLANLIRGAAFLVGVRVDPAGLLAGTRLATLVLGAGLALWLLLPRRGSCGHRTAPSLDRLGLGLLALGLLGPVLYAWYLAPALPLLALAASRGVRPGRVPDETAIGTAGIVPWVAQWLTIGLSVLLTFATIPTLAPAWHVLADHPATAAAPAAVVVAALAAGLAWSVTRLRRRLLPVGGVAGRLDPADPPRSRPEPSADVVAPHAIRRPAPSLTRL